MNIYITGKTGTYDITGIVTTASISGDYQQAARTLSFSKVSSYTDQDVPVIDIALGASVILKDSGKVLFDGFVTSSTRSTYGSTTDYTCLDRGFYLKRNKGIYKFENKTPEDITAVIASEYGLSLGTVAKTGVQISRNFLGGGNTLYDIIVTAYTLASEKNSKQYHVGFVADKLCVIEKTDKNKSVVIKGGSNLMGATATDSIENLVNNIKIVDSDGATIKELGDDKAVKDYGKLGEIIVQNKDEDKTSDAQKILDDNKLTQKITVENLGHNSCVTGGTVIVEEPYTGVCGLFYIDSDVHEWKRGGYYNKLVLNFKSIMDEKQAGSEPQKKE